ncbi:MAG: hypothetical protein KF812_08435 [Fimbriimonadaceae bacterium]|nr:hypothetical protein [Fimbriimonadaceae bacterium]
MIGFAVFASLVSTGQLRPSEYAQFMQAASYPCGSPITDPEALGGHGSSTNLPSPITGDNRGREGLQLRVVPNNGTVQVMIQNFGDPIWLDAADGNLLAWLELKDGDAWKPTEYHHWITCGNSYHRVLIPNMHQVFYARPFATGNWQTQIRLVVEAGEKTLYSEPVSVRTNRNRLLLNPIEAEKSEVYLGWGRPTLRPKGSEQTRIQFSNTL